MRKILGILAVCTFLVGCGGQDGSTSLQEKNGGETIEGVALMYDCQGEKIQAVFNNDETPPIVQLTFIDHNNVNIILSSVEAASGVQYSNDNVIFWMQQDEAMLSMSDTEQSLNCMIIDNEINTTDESVIDPNEAM